MRGNYRILLGAVFVSAFALIFLFTRTEFSSQSRTRVIETWHRVHKSTSDLTQIPEKVKEKENKRPNGKGKQEQGGKQRPMGCGSNQIEDLSWLSTYKLTPTFDYTSRDINTIQNTTSGRPLVTQINEPLFKDFSTIKLEESHTLNKTECLPPLILEVAQGPPPEEDASHIIFGMQTTMPRLTETVKHVARWLPGTGSQLHSIVVEKEGVPADTAEMRLLQQTFHNQDMNVTIIPPLEKDHSFPQRYFSIVEMLYNARTPKTKWLAIMDDDTFFPSMPALTKMLATHDHTIPQYIGSVSEDWGAIKMYGFMGFGGAGIFLSLPTAENLVAHKKDCNVNPRTTAGDITILDCIYRFSDTKLTRVNALHQMDLYDDQSGFYESGREILSTHHWKGNPNLPMDKMHLVNDICGQCFLQRWQFPGDWLLANGYSVTNYPFGHLSGDIKGKGLLDDLIPEGLKKEKDEKKERIRKAETSKIDLLAVEETWHDGGEINVDHSLGPVRPKLKEELKVSFRLVDSVLLDGGYVRQVYIKKGGEGKNDSVVVLNWRAGLEKE